MSKSLIIFGSSRSDGDTMMAVKEQLGEDLGGAELIDLKEKNISYFDYEHKNEGDDFLNIAEKMVEADKIIFATPVYWYCMSGVLKTFFDRFTDLVSIRKDLGRALKGKIVYVIACGAEQNAPDGFEKPFISSCKYLDMEYKECFYYCTKK